MAVPRDYNPYALPTTQQYAAPYSDGSLDDLVASKNTILQGATLRTSNFAGRTATVKPGENINAAIGTLKSAGGGVLFLQSGFYTLSENLIGDDKISIVGEGRDQTILDFGGGAFGISFIGTNTNILGNFRIADLTVQNSNATTAIDIDYADFWSILNVKVTSCDQKGIRIDRAQHYILRDVIVSGNTGNGIDVLGTSTRHNQYGSFENVLADSNGGIGYRFYTSTTSSFVRYFALTHCVASSNTLDGYDFSGASATAVTSFGTIIGCIADSNGGVGFDVNAYTSHITMNGIITNLNTGDNIEINGTSVTLIGAISASSSGYNLDIGTSAVNVIVTAFQQPINASTAPRDKLNISSDCDVEVSAINSGSHRTEFSQKRMKCNTTGVYAGSIVVFDPGGAANGEAFTTTTTSGDPRVVGVVRSGINQNDYGDIITAGFTTKLKVDGTTDIAVGDLLGTSTTAHIAKKAASGETAIAIALEAYTTDDTNGVIDALVISPRQV